MKTALLLCVAAALFAGAYANFQCNDGDYFHCNDPGDKQHYGHYWQFHHNQIIPCPGGPPGGGPVPPPPTHECHFPEIGWPPAGGPWKCFQEGHYYWDDDRHSGWYFEGGKPCPCGDYPGPWEHYFGGWFDLYPDHGDPWCYASHGHCGGGGGGGGGGYQQPCFPADATAQLESGESVTMENLNIGDRVLVNKPDGSLAFEDVYLFGHRDAKGASPYLTLSLEGSDSQLTLSGLHFLPVGADRHMARAEDVTVGETVWAQSTSGELAAFTIREIVSSLKRGMYNPFTMGGTIVVDGVAASSHSDWFLDAVTPKSLNRYLPAIYQATLAPVRMMYNIYGAELAKEIDAKFDIATVAAKGGLLPYASTFVKVVAATATTSNKA